MVFVADDIRFSDEIVFLLDVKKSRFDDMHPGMEYSSSWIIWRHNSGMTNYIRCAANCTKSRVSPIPFKVPIGVGCRRQLQTKNCILRQIQSQPASCVDLINDR